MGKNNCRWTAYATGHRGEGRWRLAGSYISISENESKKAGRKLVEENWWKKKARQKRRNGVRMGEREREDGARLCLVAS
jgi:hypothetical protein